MGVGEKNSFPNVSFIIYVLSSSLEVFWQASNLVFPAERDGATFRDKGTEVPSLSQDKGTKGPTKILPRDGTGQDSQNSGWNGLGQPKSGMGCGTEQHRAEKDALKQENDVLKQKTLF